MNFLRGRLVQQDGLHLELGFTRLHLGEAGGPGPDFASLIRRGGDRRAAAEDLRLGAAAGSLVRQPRLNAVLELIEPVGQRGVPECPRRRHGADAARASARAAGPRGPRDAHLFA